MDIPKIFKYAGLAACAIVVFYLGAEAGFFVKPYFNNGGKNQSLTAQNSAIIEALKKDTYGGATPEETYNLFSKAIKNNDVDLAVKYIVWDIERQQYYYNELIQLKKAGQLDDFYKTMPKWADFKIYNDNGQYVAEHSYYASKPQTVNMPDGKGGYIQEIMDPGNYVDFSINFVKNVNNIWKISSL